MKQSGLFCLKLMPLQGFDLNKKSKGNVPAHEFEVIEYNQSSFIFGINSCRKQFKNEIVHRRKPSSIHHLAFKANSKKEVEEICEKIKFTEARIVAPP